MTCYYISDYFHSDVIMTSQCHNFCHSNAGPGHAEFISFDGMVLLTLSVPSSTSHCEHQLDENKCRNPIEIILNRLNFTCFSYTQKLI